MYVFLTGPSGVGKSTALDRTLALLGVRPGGFRTGFAPDRTRLCLWPAWEAPDWSEEHTVARMVQGRLTGDPEAFDRLGLRILTESRTWARLLVLDELGWLERDAAAFRRAVRDSVAGELPVLGVIKPEPQRAGTWLESLAQVPGGTVMTVDTVNRDSLPDLLADRFGKRLRAGMEKKQERAGTSDEGRKFAAGQGL